MSTLTAPAAINADHPAGQVVLAAIRPAMSRTSALAGRRDNWMYTLGGTFPTVVVLDQDMSVGAN